MADIYGMAFVNTQGHFAEYPRNLVPEIVKNGGNVVMLTDFDCAGIHIAERIVADYKHKGKVKRIGIDLDTLEYFISRIDGGEIDGIKVKVRNDGGELVERLITT